MRLQNSDINSRNCVSAMVIKEIWRARSCRNRAMKQSKRMWLLMVLCSCLLLSQCYLFSSLLAKLTAQPKTTTTPPPIDTKITLPPPPLYVITPTYRRPEQKAELTRMGQTLMHVPHLHWLVIEDAANKTLQVTELLQRMRVSFDHLLGSMPGFYKEIGDPTPKDVSNRKRGLLWLRKNATRGVFYFADDDNTYDIQLFEEIRKTKRVSMWPVGLCTQTGVSSPIVVNGSFAGFYDGWDGNRKFPVDMAGFAVSVEFLLERPAAFMPFVAGYEEDGFLKSLAPFEPKELELKADNCTRILVWHTQTKRNNFAASLDLNKYNNRNLLKLKRLCEG